MVHIDADVIERINPNISSSFSPNLYKWLKQEKMKNFPFRIYVDKKKRDSMGTAILADFYVGYGQLDWPGAKDEPNRLSGNRMSAVLSMGRKAEKFYFTDVEIDRDIVDVTDLFLEEYVEKRKGRCFFDPEHKEYFLGERWSKFLNPEDPGYDAEKILKKCMWCGTIYERKEKTVAVTEYFWNKI